MRKLIALLLILATTPAFATFGAASAWDVRTTGVDTNGGAFDTGVGSPGTDESQGSSGTAITITLTGTTTGTGSPAFTSTTHGPGNFVHIASGSGCGVGWYEVLSQAAGVATFDHAMGVATNVCVGTIGGSLLTIGQANTNIVASNTIWIQSGTYTLTASVTWAVSTGKWTGYQTTHGDNGTKPLITTSTNSVTLINTGTSNSGVQIFTNLSLSNTAATRGSGIWQFSAHGTAQMWAFINCIFDGFNIAINNSNGTPFDVAFIHIINTEIKNDISAGAISLGNSSIKMLKVFGSYLHNNVGDINSSVLGLAPVWLEYSIFANSGAGAGIALNLSDPWTLIDHCTFANNAAADEVGLSGSSYFISITNSIFYGTTGVALTGTLDPANKTAIAAGASNAFGSNGTNFTGWGTSPGDVTLTANPFTSSGTGDYSLNSTAGGGAALKGAGFPGAFPAGTSTGHSDIGAVQSAGGGGAAAGNFGVSN